MCEQQIRRERQQRERQRKVAKRGLAEPLREQQEDEGGPDVALSELAVGTAALPLMLLVTLAILAKPREQPEPQNPEEKP